MGMITVNTHEAKSQLSVLLAAVEDRGEVVMICPALHADPFDRLLLAVAQAHKLTLLTPDPLIRRYPALRTLW